MDQERRQTSDRDRDLYFEARDRALTRAIDNEEFRLEAADAFQAGIRVVQDKHITDEELLRIVMKLKSESNYAFSFLCGAIARLEAVKGRHYAASWQKRGMMSAFMNFQRKYDRIDNIINLNSEDGGENLTSQLADQAVYSLKMMTFLAETKNVEVVSWLKEIITLD